MKKVNKRIILILTAVIIITLGVVFFTVSILKDENKLSIEEKEWITENINVVQNINVPNNLDVFGKNGSGVFFDFIKSLETEYNINVNEITYNIGEDTKYNAFKVVYDLDKKDILFHTEHYVVISKDKVNINSITNLNNKKIGVLSKDEQLVSKYLGSESNTIITTYETSTNIFEALEKSADIDFAIIPLEENLTSILTSDYSIDYHISDLNKYFVFVNKNNDTFGNIIKKYYSKWEEKNLLESKNKNELNTFVEALSISDKEIDKIQAKPYKYGFIDKSPYEILSGGEYGGIISEYLTRFSDFSNVSFESVRYKNFAKFTEAISKEKIDLYFNYYNLDTKYHKLDSLMNIPFVIAAKESNPIIINSVTSLSDKTVYVEKNSLLEKYLTSLGGINIKTYDSKKALKKVRKNDNIIVMDKEEFNYQKNSLLKNYTVRYENTLSDTYNFYAKGNNTFYNLFEKFLAIQDPHDIVVKGIYNHSYTIKTGTLINKIATYSVIIIIAIVGFVFILYNSSKKVKIAKKIKKEDKMKYIDQLTSLKNRNYLNENIANWNKNTIYPQATIVIDLNQVRNINDTLGYEEGDNQIKAAANVLIKTQLDNTDIMRTDGNEYMIYLVGYQEKQVVSYIRKLYKEFKNLPYEHGASIGYSMITSDIKTIEDAINESIEDMRNKKKEQEEK